MQIKKGADGVEGTYHQELQSFKQKILEGKLHGKKRRSAGSSSPTGELEQSNGYLQQLQKLINSDQQSETTTKALIESKGEEQFQQILQKIDENFQLANQQQQQRRSLQECFEINNSNQQKLNQNPFQNVSVQNMDANKRSTSPPSTQQQQQPILNFKNISKTNQINIQEMQSLLMQQQEIILQIEQSDNNIDKSVQIKNINKKLFEQLAYIESQDNFLLEIFEKSINNQQKSRDESSQGKNNLIDHIQQDLQQNSQLKQEIVQFFGSVQAFMTALKNDSYLTYSFIKYLNTSKLGGNQSQNSNIQADKTTSNDQTVENLIKQIQGGISNTNKGQMPRRRGSDPLYENEEYLKKIEEKYMIQFEQQFSVPEQNAKFQQQSKPQQANPKSSQKEEENKTKRKRKGSDDKYDKKEFQERMEKQIMQMLKSQFPIDSSSEDGDEMNSEKKVNSKVGDKKQNFQFQPNTKRSIEGQLIDQSLHNMLIQPTFGPIQSIPSSGSASKSQVSKQGLVSLQIEMPEEIVQMLSDSKDNLEDPNAVNFFEVENYDDEQDKNSQNQTHQLLDLNQLEIIEGKAPNVETPAFGKNKNSQFFKEDMTMIDKDMTSKKNKTVEIANNMHSNVGEDENIKKVEKMTRAASQSSAKANQSKSFTYDNWKKEVSKIIQTKQGQNKNSQFTQFKQNQINMTLPNSSSSPKQKFQQKKSPTSRNYKLDGSMSTSAGLKERICKSYTNSFLAQSNGDHSHQNMSSSQSSIKQISKQQKSPKQKDHLKTVQPRINSFRTKEETKKIINNNITSILQNKNQKQTSSTLASNRMTSQQQIDQIPKIPKFAPQIGLDLTSANSLMKDLQNEINQIDQKLQSTRAGNSPLLSKPLIPLSGGIGGVIAQNVSSSGSQKSRNSGQIPKASTLK